MTKSASRIVVAVVALAAILGVFSMADAQDLYPPTDPTTQSRGASYEPPPATANSGFLGFGSVNPVAGAATGGTDEGDATGGTGGGLALTGAATDLGVAVGLGLLAVGGTALVASRKRDDE